VLLSLKALLAMAKLVNFCLLPSGSLTVINKYHIFSDKKLVNSVKERGMSGYDVKLSGQAPYLPWAKIKGTYYHWDATTGPNIKGTACKCWYVTFYFYHYFITTLDPSKRA
jgi:hypothetical protein